jgi:mannose-6-phosphate isomerase-like protein (cupin superfamily)
VIYLLGMRNLTAMTLAFAAALSITGQTTGGSEPSTLISSGNIDAFLKALPAGKVSDNPIRVVDVGGYHVGVYGVYRPKSIPQEANIHMTKVTEVYYILEGSATLVTGGTIPDAKPMAPNSTTLQGARIEGGVSRHIAKGDVIIIPGRTPHWFSQMDSDLHYLITRPDPESTIKLK